MAFTTRAPRVTAVASDADARDSPGPGQYDDGALSLAMRRRRVNCVPFESSVPRFARERAENSSPGPGSYDVAGSPLPSSPAPADSAFRSTLPRFAERKADHMPGPGAFLGQLSSFTVSHKPKHRKQQRSSTAAARMRAVAGPPSIPARHQSTGYEVNSLGELVSLEPVPQPEPHASVAAPVARQGPTGAAWARSRERREFVRPSTAAPGPGAYEFAPVSVRRPVQRYVSARTVVGHPHKEAVVMPGPGSYDVPIEVTARRAARTSVFAGAPPRDVLEAKREEVPGPGAYTTEKGERAQERLRRQLAPKVPFSVTSKRFSQSVSLGPGPSLSHTDVLEDLSKRAYSRGSTFGNSQRTDFTAQTARGVAVPGPGSFNLDSFTTRTAKPSSMFLSKEQRLAQPRAVSPDPTKYSRELSWERGGARGAFRSRVPRVEPTRRSESPGPGAYRVPTPPPISPTAATLRGREPRFPKQTRGSSALGPGAFDIARSDLVKPSYNVTYDV